MACSQLPHSTLHLNSFHTTQGCHSSYTQHMACIPQPGFVFLQMPACSQVAYCLAPGLPLVASILILVLPEGITFSFALPELCLPSLCILVEFKTWWSSTLCGVQLLVEFKSWCSSIFASTKQVDISQKKESAWMTLLPYLMWFLLVTHIQHHCSAAPFCSCKNVVALSSQQDQRARQHGLCKHACMQGDAYVLNTLGLVAGSPCFRKCIYTSCLAHWGSICLK